jgi:hypothetical protein
MIRIAISEAAFEAIARTLPQALAMLVDRVLVAGAADTSARPGGCRPARRDARAGREL